MPDVPVDGYPVCPVCRQAYKRGAIPVVPVYDYAVVPVVPVVPVGGTAWTARLTSLDGSQRRESSGRPAQKTGGLSLRPEGLDQAGTAPL